ncbi:unnamed protein product [Gongylonema pulchrum]|uniref:Vitellogenin domain-containing protein n=1 Tax=Gongylonema pulchrum TaxID=637853 RepID=A0A183DA30_9BILA|nr:unnamed protein product [Gongylonema pulchrum]
MPEAIKSINMEKCRRRVDIRYGYQQDSIEGSENCIAEQTRVETESSTVFHYYLNGNSERFLIRRVDIHSHHSFSPFEKHTMGTFVTGKLELMKIVTGVKEQPSPASEHIESIEYSAEREIQIEKFIMFGDDEYSDSLFRHSRRKYEQIGEIIEKMIILVSGRDSQQQLHVTNLMDELVELLRMCSKEKIQKIHGGFFESSSWFKEETVAAQIRDLLLDGLVQAGTQNTIEYIIQQIKNYQIPLLKSIKLLSQLVKIRITSSKHIDTVLELCNSEVCAKNPVLRQTCLLTVGGLMYTMCVAHGDQLASRLATEFCPPAIKKKYYDVSLLQQKQISINLVTKII